MISLPYDRRDSDAILEYLKSKAEELSEGKWTDFSNGDIGTVILKLMAYLADMNNYQIDKGLAELYIDSLTERDSAVSLTKLVGYEPRGYRSHYATVSITPKPGNSVNDGTEIPIYTQFTDQTKAVSYCNVEPAYYIDNKCKLVVYEGTYSSYSTTSSSIDDNSRIYLDEFRIDPNTVRITIAGDVIKRVDNVLTDISNQLCYSVHVGDGSELYIQLPSYWNDFIPTGAAIFIQFLITKGESGGIGAHIITRPFNDNDLGLDCIYLTVDNNLPSTGGSDPETIEDIQSGAPLFASTMSTLVTLDDLQLAKYEVDGIADIIALDYNSPESGLVQPADAYKVNVYVLPKDSDYIIDPDEELTTTGKELKAFIDKHRLTSIMINYKNVEILTPEISINAYINRYDLRADTLESTIKNIILKNYDRSIFKIGEGIYSSKLSKQILDEVNYCNYIEVTLPDDSYIPTKMQFLKVSEDNITVNVIEE